MGSQRRDHYYGGSYPGLLYENRTYARDTRFSLGITYRFLGRLDGPGLIGPVRPMH